MTVKRNYISITKFTRSTGCAKKQIQYMNSMLAFGMDVQTATNQIS